MTSKASVSLYSLFLYHLLLTNSTQAPWSLPVPQKHGVLSHHGTVECAAFPPENLLPLNSLPAQLILTLAASTYMPLPHRASKTTLPQAAFLPSLFLSFSLPTFFSVSKCLCLQVTEGLTQPGSNHRTPINLYNWKSTVTAGCRSSGSSSISLRFHQ